MININKDLKQYTISAAVTRADGTVEELGVISYWNKNPFKRLLWNIKRKIKEIYKWLLGFKI